MKPISRRQFFKRTAIASMVGVAALTGVNKKGQAASEPMATVIDLTQCDGCKGEAIPRCVSACKEKNQSRYPKPQKPILDYWPRKGYEDWSDKQQVINRLTPYNWIYVQKAAVNGNTVYIPRRCMHCENPPCAKLCPFSAISIHQDSSVTIDPEVCFGGAKCRDVCPWGVPSRQAGLGLYMKLAPTYGGGGVMYKCDMCHDLVEKGQQPACVKACPRQAMTFGPRSAMKKLANERKQAVNGYLYGLRENGGTATYYISSVSFAELDAAIQATGELDGKPGRSGVPSIANKMDELKNLSTAMLIAPVAGIFAAGWSAYRSIRREEKE
ncbi:MAG: 4Fe-4S dicluster protein [Firmicutes bacterium]|nr:4Fe-4S dicluster protein [Bacillota bacterium]